MKSRNASISIKYPIIVSAIGLCLIAVSMLSAHLILQKRLNGFREELSRCEAEGQNKKFDALSHEVDTTADGRRNRDALVNHLLDRFEMTLKRAGLMLTLAVIAITVLLGVILGRKISSPLMTIADATKKISDGDLSVVVPVQSRDEIGALAERFNAMVEKLKIAYSGMKSTTDMLTESGARYRTLSNEFNVLLDAIPDNLTLISTDLKTVWVNQTAACALGRDSNDAIGKYCYEIWYGRHTLCDNCYALKCLESGSVVEDRIMNKGGTFDVKAFPLRDEKGTIKNIFIIGRDVTEKIRIEETARRTYHLAQLGRLSAGMGHEINNPNNFILSNAQMLQDIWYDAARILRKYYNENGDFKMGGLLFSEMDRNVSQILYRIIEGSQRIKNIVAGLRSYSLHREDGAYEDVDINRVINCALLIVGHQIKKFTDSFAIDLAARLPLVRGENSALEQMVINIIMNALQALPDKSCPVRISSSFDEKDKQVIITVKDEGTGMPPAIIERVFDPFFTTKHDKGGTGLGLSISHSIIKKSNGSIEFESSPGKGTTVIIKLPVVADVAHELPQA